MTRLIFLAEEVRRIVEHSIAAPGQLPVLVDYDAYTSEPITRPPDRPTILLVKDQGTYLMSGGTPPDLREPPHPRRFVVYARGCDPEKDANWYETGRNIMGGDDCAEHLPWAEAIKAQIDAGAHTIIIEVGEGSVALLDQDLKAVH